MTTPLTSPQLSESDTTPAKRHLFCRLCRPDGPTTEPAVLPAFCGVIAPSSGKPVPPRATLSREDHCDACVDVDEGKRPGSCIHWQ